uniref:Secreted protein n=1 Tax=Cacopsylla melanoneura TaxID=428564 RepID=A0A8D9FGA5_9HEMI
MSKSLFLAARCSAVSPLIVVAFSCSAVCVDSNSRHMDWLPASTASRSGILPFPSTVIRTSFPAVDSNALRILVAVPVCLEHTRCTAVCWRGPPNADTLIPFLLSNNLTTSSLENKAAM